MLQKILSCYTLAEALKVSGFNYWELYYYLKAAGVEQPSSWVAPSDYVIDSKLETELELEFQVVERFRSRRRYVEYDSSIDK